MDKKMDTEIINKVIEAYESGLTLEDVGRQFNTTRSSIWRLLRKHDYKRRGRGLKCTRETPLTFLQYELLDGLMLGDGSLGVSSKLIDCAATLYFGCIHEDIVNYVVNQIPIQSKLHVRQRNKPFYRMWTVTDITLTKLYKKWYPNNTKCIPRDLQLTPRSIRFWYYGDGSNCSNKVHHGRYNYRSLYLSTESFTKDDCEFLCQCLLDVTDSHWTLHKNGLNKAGVQRYNLYCSMSDNEKFLTAISPCEFSSFAYKWVL